MFIIYLLVLTFVAIAEFKLGQKYEQDKQQEYLDSVSAIPLVETTVKNV